MSESVGSSEFLLGIEEYLRYLKHDRQADSVHTLSRTMSQEDQKNASVKAFLQDSRYAKKFSRLNAWHS